MKEIIAKRKSMWYGLITGILASILVVLFSIFTYNAYILIALILTIPVIIYHLICIIIWPRDIISFNKDTRTFIIKKTRKRWIYKNVCELDSAKDYKRFNKFNSGTLYLTFKDETEMVLYHIDYVDNVCLQINNILRFFKEEE